ncbi:MAG: hypothetical protein ACK5LV_04945 [Lachnospirales bacterium]
MYSEFGKNMCIINEILHHCNILGASKYNVSLDIQDNLFSFCIEVIVSNINSNQYNYIQHALSLPRQNEYEYFVELCGEGGHLQLVGLTLDNAKVECIEGLIRITGNKRFCK